MDLSRAILSASAGSPEMSCISRPGICRAKLTISSALASIPPVTSVPCEPPKSALTDAQVSAEISSIRRAAGSLSGSASNTGLSDSVAGQGPELGVQITSRHALWVSSSRVLPVCAQMAGLASRTT